MNINILNESRIRLEGLDTDEYINFRKYFSFYAENYQWHPKFKAGIWDGTIQMIDRYGNMNIGLLKRVKRYCEINNIEYNVIGKKLSKGFTLTPEIIDKFYKETLKGKLELRSYQIDAIQKVFKENKNICILPTGSGKSLTQYIVAQLFLKMNPEGKVLLIVPTVSLVYQMQGDFIEYAEDLDPNFESKIHCICSGKEKESEKPIIISTWQSLQRLPKKHFEQYDCVLCDEVHSSESGVVLQTILGNCVNSVIRFGCSGSLSDTKVNLVQLESLFGTIYTITKTKDLIKDGYLSQLKINCLILNYNQEEKKIVHNANYADEMLFLREHNKRLKFIVNLTKKINKNIMILFRNLDYGKALYDQACDIIDDRNIYYIAGSTKVELREEVRKVTSESKNNIIFASLAVFSTGINIPTLDCVVFAQPIKSKIKVIQSIGRVLRKTNSKNTAILYDISDNLTYKRKQNFSIKHARERIKLYQRESFNYNIKEINLF